MSWINAFELMCYAIVAIMLVDLIRKKDYDSLFTFGSAAIVGFVMELLAVAVTDIYYYNPEFLLNLGAEPKQFPVFGGFMWGGLTVYGIQLAKKLNWKPFPTALAAGMFIVTMDILLDVVAIRLDGGFWVWVGKKISLDIDQHTFMSVIWVNFLGYMIETPTVVLLTLRKQKKVVPTDFKKQALHMVLIALAAIGFTAVGSLISLGLNVLTDDWFACIAFALLWVIMIVWMVCRTVNLRLKPGKVDIPALIFWSAMYGYCLAALCGLGIHTQAPWFLVVGILFAAGTLYITTAKDHA
jgi:hypothetical protein